MNRKPVEFKLGPRVNLDEAELTLRLAVLGAAGLHGENEIRLRSRARLRRGRRSIVIEGAPEVVASISRLLCTFMTREFGERSLEIRGRSAPGVA